MKCLKKRMDHIIAAALPVLACVLLTAITSAQVWDRQSFEGGENIEIIPESVQVDSLGRIHIVHRRDGMLIYHRYDGMGWIREILTSELICNSSYCDLSFTFCLGPDDLPLVSFHANYQSFTLSRDEEGWKTSDGCCICDIDGNPHYTYREWDQSAQCDRIYHRGPEGIKELDFCFYDDDISDIDLFALRKYRYPTVVFVDCDGCTINFYWYTDDGFWRSQKIAGHYHQNCWSSCYYIKHDHEGDAHILYQYDGMGLTYFRWSPEGASWSPDIDGTGTNNLAVDNLQTAHMGYRGEDSLKYARIEYENVYTEVIDPNDTWADIVSSGVLPDLTPLVLAYNEPNGELILWTREDEVWAPLILDRKTTEITDFATVSDSSFGRYALYVDRTSRLLKFAHQEATIWTVETIMAFAGETPGLCALACDKQNRLHMACYLPDTRDIVYGLKTGSAVWQLETIPVAGDVSGMDLTTDTAGNPLICYQDGNLVLLNKTETEWVTSILDNSGTVSGDLSICTGSQDSTKVLYFRSTLSGADAVFLYGGGMKWRQEIIHSFNGPAGTCDLVLDASDQPQAVLTYSNEGADPDAVWNIDHARRSVSGWSLSTIGTGRGMTDAGIVLDKTNCEHIVCQDRVSGCLAFRQHENRWLPTLLADSDSGQPGVDLALSNDDQISIMFRSQNGLIHTQQNLPEVGVRLDMPYREFLEGHPCYLYAYLCNRTAETLEANLFILLQYGDAFWFYPSWSTVFSSEPGMCSVPVDLPDGLVCKEIIPWFDWAHAPMGCEGLVFYGALVDPGLTHVLGDIDGLGEWEFKM